MIPAEDLERIEAEANEALWKNLPVNCWYPSQEELPKVFYRTKRALPWPVRIVQVPGYDSCACCGIHVASTGQVGLIKILSASALRGGIRLQMVCGGRAYRWITRVFEENRKVSQAFSAKMDATGEAARKMNEALAAEKQKVAGLYSKIFDTVAQSYEGKENVLHFEEDLEPVQVRLLADRIAGKITGWCAVFSGGSYCLAARQGDLRQLNKDMTAALDGRGGGKPNFQQGSVRADKAQIQAFFAEL